VFGAKRKSVDHRVRDAVEHSAGEFADKRVVEFVAKRELDLACLRRQLDKTPLAAEVPERARSSWIAIQCGRRFGFRVVRSKRSP